MRKKAKNELTPIMFPSRPLYMQKEPREALKHIAEKLESLYMRCDEQHSINLSLFEEEAGDLLAVLQGVMHLEEDKEVQLIRRI